MKGVAFFIFFAFLGCKSSNTMTQTSNEEGTQFVPQYKSGPAGIDL